jgi:hypothetical protein
MAENEQAEGALEALEPVPGALEAGQELGIF